jgi:hypothetical protein
VRRGSQGGQNHRRKHGGRQYDMIPLLHQQASANEDWIVQRASNNGTKMKEIAR